MVEAIGIGVITSILAIVVVSIVLPFDDDIFNIVVAVAVGAIIPFVVVLFVTLYGFVSVTGISISTWSILFESNRFKRLV